MIISLFQAISLFFIIISLGNIFYKSLWQNQLKKSTEQFVVFTIGAFLLITFYAVFKCGFKTVQLIYLIPISALIILERNSLNFNIKKIFCFSDLPILPFIILIIFFFIQIFFRIEGGSITTFFYEDVQSYAEFSKQLNLGNENQLGSLNNLYFKNVTIRTPYHYTELWLTAFICNLFSYSKYSIAFIQVTVPVLSTIVFLGFRALTDEFSSRIRFNNLIASGLFFIGPSNDFFNKPILDLLSRFFNNTTVVFENSTHLNHFLLAKNYPFYIIIILFFILLVKNKRLLALILLCFALIANIGLLPGVGLFIFLYSLYLLKFKRQLQFKHWLLLNTCLLLTIVSLFTFYFFYGLHNIGTHTVSGSYLYQFFQVLTWKGELIRVLYRSLGSIIWILVLYLMFIIFYFFEPLKFKTYREREYFLMTMLLLTGGILSRIFLDWSDSSQFISYLLPFVNVVISIVCIERLKDGSKFILLFLFFSIIINFSEYSVYTKNFSLTTQNNLYSKKYTSKVFSELDNQHEINIGWFLSSKELIDTPPYIWGFKRPAKYLTAFGFYNYYNLNDPSIRYPESSFTRQENWGNHLKYYKPKEKIEYREKLKMFINEYNIQYIVFKSFDDLKSYSFLSFKIVAKDKVSGEIFVRIEKNSWQNFNL